LVFLNGRGGRPGTGPWPASRPAWDGPNRRRSFFSRARSWVGDRAFGIRGGLPEATAPRSAAESLAHARARTAHPAGHLRYTSWILAPTVTGGAPPRLLRKGWPPPRTEHQWNARQARPWPGADGPGGWSGAGGPWSGPRSPEDPALYLAQAGLFPVRVPGWTGSRFVPAGQACRPGPRHKRHRAQARIC